MPDNNSLPTFAEAVAFLARQGEEVIARQIDEVKLLADRLNNEITEVCDIVEIGGTTRSLCFTEMAADLTNAIEAVNFTRRAIDVARQNTEGTYAQTK